MRGLAQVCTRSIALGVLFAGGYGCAEDELVVSTHLLGDDIIVELDSADALYRELCGPAPVIEKNVDGAWESRRLESPSDGAHAGFFLDDGYVEPVSHPRCDVGRYCAAFDGSFNVGPAIEIVADGTRELPASVDDPGAANPAPAYVTVPLSGPLRIEVGYSKDSDCSSYETKRALIDADSGS